MHPRVDEEQRAVRVDDVYGFTGVSIEIHGPPNIATRCGALLVAAVTATRPTTIIAPSAARETSERVVRMIGSMKVVPNQMPGVARFV